MAPCIIIDVGVGNAVTIKNTKLLMKSTIEGNSKQVKTVPLYSTLAKGDCMKKEMLTIKNIPSEMLEMDVSKITI